MACSGSREETHIFTRRPKEDSPRGKNTHTYIQHMKTSSYTTPGWGWERLCRMVEQDPPAPPSAGGDFKKYTYIYIYIAKRARNHPTWVVLAACCVQNVDFLFDPRVFIGDIQIRCKSHKTSLGQDVRLTGRAWCWDLREQYWLLLSSHVYNWFDNFVVHFGVWMLAQLKVHCNILAGQKTDHYWCLVHYWEVNIILQ